MLSTVEHYQPLTLALRLSPRPASASLRPHCSHSVPTKQEFVQANNNFGDSRCFVFTGGLSSPFWLPFLFIPSNASPAFIFLFFVCTYFLNRPCFYCSFLLLVLFLTSCNWSDRCFLDFGGNWFQSQSAASYVHLPVPGSKGPEAANNTATEGFNSTASAVVAEMLNTTAQALATAATQQVARAKVEWTGLGVEWLRSFLGRREWRIDCLDLSIRL
ncbi:hypothetical protein VTK56DRAFT_10199 [Thermocarpiscus australiensis]